MLNITCNNIALSMSLCLTGPGRGRRDGSDHCHVSLYPPLYFRFAGAADTHSVSVAAAAGVQSRCEVRKVPLLLLGLRIQPFLTGAHPLVFSRLFCEVGLMLRLFSTLPPPTYPPPPVTVRGRRRPASGHWTLITPPYGVHGGPSRERGVYTKL